MIPLKSFLDELFVTDLLRGADTPRRNRSKTVIVRYKSVEQTDDTLMLHFDVRHKPENGGTGRTHNVDVLLVSYPELKSDITMSDEERLKYAMVSGDVKVQCTCEDFTYKGFAYMGTELDYSLHDESRFPKFRNPNLEGSVCKHCLSTLGKLNLFYNKIISDVTRFKLF